MKTSALIVALAFSTAVLAGDIDRYKEFQRKGVFDADVSNRDANAIVGEGIKSGDPEIVVATLGAIGWFAAYQNGIGRLTFGHTRNQSYKLNGKCLTSREIGPCRSRSDDGRMACMRHG